MRRWKATIALATALTWGLTTSGALGQQKPGKTDRPAKLPACPVSGQSVDFSTKTVTDDGPVYFCCTDCIQMFRDNTKKYAAKVAAQRQALAKMERVQVACPLSGKPVNSKVFVEHNGEKVYFCCAGCKDPFQKEPSKYQAKLADSYTYQAHCPVMGGKIDPASYADLATGQRIYFCCPGCDKKLFKDPAKYAPKLAAQGINVDPKKLKPAADKPGKDKP